MSHKDKYESLFLALMSSGAAPALLEYWQEQLKEAEIAASLWAQQAVLDESKRCLAAIKMGHVEVIRRHLEQLNSYRARQERSEQ